MKRCNPTERDELLDVGVTDQDSPDANYLEWSYRYPHRVTAAGLMAESPFHPQLFSSLRYVQITDSRLPFEDRAFDVVHSSAVLEHVGGKRAQWRFLGELWRVCRRVLYVTTPNRWAPVEFHTGLPLLHWLPQKAWSACARRLGHEFYSRDENLRLLGTAGLERLAVKAGMPNACVSSVKLLGWASNLVLHSVRS